jgi:hypothetical protein
MKMKLTVTYSPYSRPIATLYIGTEMDRYFVHKDLLQSPYWLHAEIMLPDVHQDIGHTLAHYLYTGEYQTRNPMVVVLARQRQFRMAVLVYLAADRYRIGGLRQLAAREVERFGMDMEFSDIVFRLNKDFQRAPDDKGWFCDYLKTKAKPVFEEDHTAFENGFIDGISNATFKELMSKCVREIYYDRISQTLDLETKSVRTTSDIETHSVNKLASDDELVIVKKSDHDLICPQSPSCAMSIVPEAYLSSGTPSVTTSEENSDVPSYNEIKETDIPIDQVSCTGPECASQNEAGICPEQAEHLSQEATWKGCRQCRAFLLERALHHSRDEYISGGRRLLDLL